MVYMSCFIEAGGEGLEHLEFWAAILQHLLFEEGETLLSVTSASSCQTLAFFKPSFLYVEWKDVCFSFFPLLIFTFMHIYTEKTCRIFKDHWKVLPSLFFCKRCILEY